MLQSIKKIILFILQNIPTKHVTANIVTIRKQSKNGY